MAKNKLFIFVGLVFLLLLVCSQLIIPWAYVNNTDSNKKYIGYYSIWNRPQLKAPAEMKKLFSLLDNSDVYRFEVKPFTFLLNLERGALLALLVAILIGARANTRLLKVFAVFIAMIGFFFIYLLILALTQIS